MSRWGSNDDQRNTILLICFVGVPAFTDIAIPPQAVRNANRFSELTNKDGILHDSW